VPAASVIRAIIASKHIFLYDKPFWGNFEIKEVEMG
jgi:hypothetical protein